MTDLASTAFAALTLAPAQYVGVARHSDPAPVLVVGFLVAAVLGLVALRARHRLAVKRLELLRELAASGHLTPRALEEQLRPKRIWLTAALVTAWFGLFGGAALLLVATINEWRGDFEAIGAFGLFTFVASLATITAPLALREMRRAGAER